MNISNKRQGKETDNFAIERFVMNWKPRIETWMEMNHARTVRIMIQGPKKNDFSIGSSAAVLNFPIECFMEAIKPVA